jgi:pyruvate dehydrogenase E2 component (dihydrolipoamide acetyltransferase)
MDEGTFTGWVKQQGDRIQPGDPLFVLESDKASEEVAALDGGILRVPANAPKPGDKVKVGQVLAYLAAEGEEVPLASPEQATGTASHLAALPASDPHSAATPTRRQRAISPRARRAAAELGIDCSGIQGSGRKGRIRERDVRAAAGRRPEGRLIPHTNLRRTIAARMVAGVTQAAPVTLTATADATNLVSLRNQFKATATSGEDVVPSYTDLVLKLASIALRQHPLLQAQWREDGLFVPDRIDVAIAVDAEAGLLVPVVREVDRLSLRQVAARSRDLIALARAGRLGPEQMRDATFTVTNLGRFGIDAFTPILHLPQCAVLGVGRIVREPAVLEDRIVPRDRLTLSLTFDHRVVDGAVAARFLDTLRGCLEQPAPWLMP